MTDKKESLNIPALFKRIAEEMKDPTIAFALLQTLTTLKNIGLRAIEIKDMPIIEELHKLFIVSELPKFDPPQKEDETYDQN